MNCKVIVTMGITLMAVCAGLASAEGSDSSSIKTKLEGMGSIEAGQYVRCEINGGDNVTEKLWYEKAYMHLGFVTTINERTRLSFVGEGMVHFAYDLSKDKVDDNRPQYTFYPHDVSFSYSWGDVSKPWLKFAAGVFPFKYNPDVRNLGEYLFRTGTYPPTMRNQFDFPMARLMGFHLSSTPVDSLNIHLLMTSESQVLPLQDWGLSFLVDYTAFKMVSVGAGICYSHLWSVNDKYTTPKNSNNAIIDTSTGLPTGDYYTFQGTKLMGRLSVDLKRVLPWDIFGPNDLKVYSEIAILGVQNQGIYYDSLYRRVPFLLGFNFPAFKLLDVLSIELEWYQWNYRNSYSTYLFAGMIPRPDNDAPVADWEENKLKWSIYTKKTIGEHFSITGQIAYDHMQFERNVYLQAESYYGDAMHKHGDWAWILKTAWNF